MTTQFNLYNQQVFLDLPTRTRFGADGTNTDVLVQAASGNPTLDNEDYRPSSISSNFFRGFANRLEGHDANVLFHARFSSITRRGNRVSTHDTRARFVWRDTVNNTRAVNLEAKNDKPWNVMQPT